MLVVPVALVVAFAVYSAATDADRDDTGAVDDGGKVSAMDLQLGDCITLPSELGSEQGTDVSTLAAVPCTDPHEAEVFAQVKITAATYSGEKELVSFSDRECGQRFGAFVGRPIADSALQLSYLYPSKETWARGDRTVTCIVSTPAGEQATGTLKGSKR